LNILTITDSLSGRLNRLSPGLRKIIGNTGWLLLDRIVRLGLGVVVGVWVARYLGPSGFGILNFATSFIALFGTLTTLGIENILLREIVLDRSQAPEILGTGFALRACASVIAPLIAIASIRLIQPDDRVAQLLVSLLSVGLVFQAFDTIDSYFQSQVQSKLTVWAKNSAFLLIAGVRIFLVYIKAPLWCFAVAQVSELALGACGLIIAYRLNVGRLSLWHASKQRAIKLLSQSWPVMLSGMAIMIYMRIDIVMLKVMQGDPSAGIYAAATRVSEVWYFIPTAIVSSVWPSIIRARENPTLYYVRIGRLFCLMTFIAVVLGASIALSSPWLIHTLYSDAFSAAAPVLAVHVWASVFVFLGVAQAPWDFSEDLLKLGFYRTVAGGIANIVLNIILIPKYSAVGSAIATVMSYAISSVFGNACSAKTRPIFVIQMRSFVLADLWHKDASRAGRDRGT
jgi:PST family polysaccharide transporter